MLNITLGVVISSRLEERKITLKPMTFSKNLTGLLKMYASRFLR